MDKCIVCGMTEDEAPDFGSHENVAAGLPVIDTCSDACAQVVEEHRGEDGWLDYTGEDPLRSPNWWR